MTADELRAASSADGLPPLLAALWHDATGDWERAHEIAQSVNDRSGAHVHAYLHRKEGDEGNARYWYAQAGRGFPGVPLDEEWDQLASSLGEALS